MKKQFFLIGCFFLIFLSGIGRLQASAQEPVTLGPSRMIELAVLNNLDFKIALVQLENTRLEVQKMEAENLLSESTLSDLQKEITLLGQQNQFQLEKDQLFIKVVDDYFRLLMAEKEIESQEQNVELEEIILESVEKQVAAGYSIDLNLLQQGNEYYDALFSYQESMLNHQQLIMEVKNSLGLPREQDIRLTEMALPGFPEINLEEAIQQASKNSVALKSQSLKINQAERELEKARVSDDSGIEIKKLENNFTIAQLEKSLSQHDLDDQVETQWLKYNQAKNAITLSQKSLEEIRENESMIRQQVQAGLRTDEELLSATIGVLDAQSRLISSVRQVYQAYLELHRLMGTLDKGVLP
jgi:outer membrane protein TolC